MNAVAFGVVVAIAIVLAAITLSLLFVLGVRTRQDSRLKRRVLGQDAPAEDFEEATANPAVQGLARTGKSVEQWVDKEGETPRLLAQAGWRGADRRLVFYVFQAVLPLLMVLLLVALWTLGKTPGLSILLYAFVLFSLSFLVPRWVLRSAANARRQRIAREVPLLLHLLVLLFEAGLSIRQAFASIVRDGGGVLPELGSEFELVIRQLEAGAETADVLKNLGEAMSVDDLTGVLAVLRQVDRYGGEVRGPLLEAMSLIEERRGLELREKVNLISGRMTVIMVLFFFPALLIFVAGPAVVSLMKALGAVSGGG
ncbi:type II secretion system F family protein [Stagnimonas aquatica]|uniref:Type II secretion system F family protein n=1 Tax=Stagnimonas aquatica TaxID=2689987 RepID=A0A3N0VJP5_9GAMM|nr:type II secretion system F family protein [Stagnimonas aquatica]ROH92983.1 type II secretion system F family protein [Stagnimonas aquatica]